MYGKKTLAFASLVCSLATGSAALAQSTESAAPQEVVTKVLEAVQYLNE